MRTVAGSRLQLERLRRGDLGRSADDKPAPPETNLSQLTASKRFASAKLYISTEGLWVLTPAPVALLNTATSQ
jgi:hypothetical protein